MIFHFDDRCNNSSWAGGKRWEREREGGKRWEREREDGEDGEREESRNLACATFDLGEQKAKKLFTISYQEIISKIIIFIHGPLGCIGRNIIAG